MSKKIQLKPVALAGSRAIGKTPNTVTVQLPNNGNASKRTHFPQQSEDSIRTDDVFQDKSNYISKKQRQAEKQMQFPEPQFELDAMTADRISSLDSDERIVAFSQHYLTTMQQQMEQDHKDDPQFLMYLRMAHQIMLKGLKDFKGDKQDRRLQDESHHTKVEGWLSKPDKDRFELRKRQSIRQLLRETEGVWQHKIQLQTKGFDGPAYDDCRQRIQKHVEQKSGIILEKQMQQEIQSAVSGLTKHSSQSYNQIHAQSMTIHSQQETILELIEETQQNVDEIERLLAVLAQMKKSSPSQQFGRPVEYRTWSLVDVLDDYLPPNLIIN